MKTIISGYIFPSPQEKHRICEVYPYNIGFPKGAFSTRPHISTMHLKTKSAQGIENKKQTYQAMRHLYMTTS